MKLKELSEIFHGEILGNPDTEITGVSGIKNAVKGDITFISSSQYVKYLKESGAACVIVKEWLSDIAIPQIKVQNPHYAFAKAIEIFYPRPAFKPVLSSQAFISDRAVTGINVCIHPFVYVSDGAMIGDETIIMPGVFIGENTKIGANCFIYSNVVIREGVTIGDRVIIHAGTVIGSDGFGYVKEKGEHYKIPQVGGVVIEDDVEIGSNVSIDRATIGRTIIRKGTKIDNLVQIAHNVTIGENSLIIAQVGIAGSTDIGDYVVLGGQAGIADHTTIESGTMVAAQSGITGQITKGIYSGSPGIPHSIWLRAQALFARLPELYKKIKELEEKVNKLEKGD